MSTFGRTVFGFFFDELRAVFGWSEKDEEKKMTWGEFSTRSHNYFSFQFGKKMGRKMITKCSSTFICKDITVIYYLNFHFFTW